MRIFKSRIVFQDIGPNLGPIHDSDPEIHGLAVTIHAE